MMLIVDHDSQTIRDIREGMDLATLGYDRVLTAGGYAETLNVFKNTYVDVMICDIEMPEKNGLELIGYVNEHSPNTTCIILTGLQAFRYAQTAVRLNCIEYAVKPVEPVQLAEILRRAAVRVDQRRRYEQLKLYATQYLNSVTNEIRNDTLDALGTATAYIEAHLAEELSVRELAGMCYISADHLTRMFKKKYGRTVSEYIQDKRLRLAGVLLAQGDLSVSAVSDRVGFGNYSYFTEQFKKAWGMTPREYQKKNRNKP